MKNYDPNYAYGKHTVEITLQNWQYTGKIRTKIKGNCKGFNVLESAKDIYEDDKYESDCEFKIQDDWFSCVLKDENGNKLDIDDELDNLEDYIVKLEIIDFEEENL